MELKMGQYDAPQKQKQPLLKINPFRGHIAVWGLPLSGKTTFIKTLLVRLHENPNPMPAEDVYIIDFGGNIGDYRYLRNVCAYCDSSNEENIKRILHTVEKRLTENLHKLEGRNYLDVAENSPETAPAHMFLIVENINSLFAEDKYAMYQEQLYRLCRDGVSRGLTVVASASDPRGVSRLMSSFGQKVAFEMPPDTYYDIFNCRVAKTMRVPGRGVVNVGSETFEFQCFLPFPGEDDSLFLPQLIQEAREQENPRKLQFFPERLTWDNIRQCCDPALLDCDPGQTVVALDYLEHEPVKLDFELHRTFAVTGKRNFGKSNLLKMFFDATKKYYPNARYVLFDDGRKGLDEYAADGHSPLSQDCFYTTEFAAFLKYLREEGYVPASGGLAGPREPVEEKKLPPTVFVLYGKKLFTGASGRTSDLMVGMLQTLYTEAFEKDFIFIFPDLPHITNSNVRESIYDNLSVIFLLDDIADYMAKQGSGTRATVWGERDPRDLRTEYARCEKGDGFYFDIDADDLRKIKLIQVESKEVRDEQW